MLRVPAVWFPMEQVARTSWPSLPSPLDSCAMAAENRQKCRVFVDAKFDKFAELGGSSSGLASAA